MSTSNSQRYTPGCAVGVLWLSDRWEVQQASEAMLGMLEIEGMKDLLGAPAMEFVSPEFREALLEERARRREGVASSYESVLLGRKGTRRKVLVSGTPVTSDGVSTTRPIAQCSARSTVPDVDRGCLP